MPRPKNYEKQIDTLNKKLETYKKQTQKKIADLEAKRVREVEEAARVGYELGQTEIQKLQLKREKFIADALKKFDKQHAKTKKPSAKVGKAKVGAKRRGRPPKSQATVVKKLKKTTKPGAKRRGRPPKSAKVSVQASKNDLLNESIETV